MGSVLHNRLSEVEGPVIDDDNTELILYHRLRKAAEEHPHKVAVISRYQSSELYAHLFETLLTNGRPSATSQDGLRWTHSQLWHATDILARSLLAQGFDPSRPLAVFLGNGIEWVLFCLACIRLGAIFVPFGLKSLESVREVQHQLASTRPACVVAVDQVTLDKAHQLAPGVMRAVKLEIILDGESSPTSQSIGDVLASRPPSISLPEEPQLPADTVAYFFTSGTTSLPKLVPCTSKYYSYAGIACLSKWHLDSSRRLVHHLPSMHCYGVLGIFAFLSCGASVVMPSPAFNPQATIEAVHMERCTEMMGNPAMIDLIINQPEMSPAKMESLLHINVGGSICHPSVLTKCLQPPLSVKYATAAFGMTETGMNTSWDIFLQQPKYTDCISVGTTSPGQRLRVCEPESTKPVPWGEIGELHVGTPYTAYNVPGRDESWLYVEDDFRWVVTGDQARLGDMGEVYVMGRYKDLIIRGGAKVSPAAIEAVLNTIPNTSVLVVGLPDQIAGEVPVAIVKTAEDFATAQKRIRQLSKESLGLASSPHSVVALADLGLQAFPLAPSGKPDKKILRELLVAFNSSKSKSMPNGYSVTGLTPTEQTLREIWALLSGQQPEDIPITEEHVTYADSLLVLQYPRVLEKRLKKRITLAQLVASPTVQSLAIFVDKQPTIDEVTNLHAHEPQTPKTADAVSMVHVRKGAASLEDTKRAIGDSLQGTGLSWDDVEEVFPAHDQSRHMLEYANSSAAWNDRQVRVVNVDAFKLRSAVESSLHRFSVFRSAAVRFNDDLWLQVVFKLSRNVFDKIVKVASSSIDSVDSLLQEGLTNPGWDKVTASFPLATFDIVPIGNGGQTAFVFVGDHSNYDALSMQLWLDVLMESLEGSARNSRVTYKHFADAYYLGRQSATSVESRRYFAEKFQRCAEYPAALWPVKKGSQWLAVSPAGRVKGSRCETGTFSNRTIDPESECIGHIGLTAHLRISPSALEALQSSSGIAVQSLLRAAIAMLIAHRTGADRACFSHWEAARSWPFVDSDAYGALLPDAMDIPGPTATKHPDMIEVHKSDSVLDFLCRVQRDAAEARKHAHAPVFEVARMLAENANSGTAKQDAEIYIDLMERHV